MDQARRELDLDYLVRRVYIGIDKLFPLLLHKLQLVHPAYGMAILILDGNGLQQLHILVSDQQPVAAVAANQMSLVVSESPARMLPF